MQLFLDGHLTAVDNMKRDDELHAAAQPVVRLYGWKPEAVSLGNSQSEDAIDLDVVEEYGLDVVKRGTGGGGILHNATEVTYAVVLPLDYPGLTNNITESFALISRGIILGLNALGVPAELEIMPDKTRDSLCYVRVQGTNVTVRGRKISGGAQRRTKWAILQHGTVIVDRDEAAARADLPHRSEPHRGQGPRVSRSKRDTDARGADRKARRRVHGRVRSTFAMRP